MTRLSNLNGGADIPVCRERVSLQSRQTRMSAPPKFVALCLGLSLLAIAARAADAPFRPEAGKFPPLEKALSYRGELVFVDHVNRRGSVRVPGAGTYFRNNPHPSAM